MVRPAESLGELLRELEAQRGLRGRLRVLGRSFQLLRSLSPADRERVALRVGSDWAWKRLERAFMQDGELSPSEDLARRALERVGEADPGELRGLARTLREGDRKAVEDVVLSTLASALDEEADDQEADAATVVAEAGDAPQPGSAIGGAAAQGSQPTPAAEAVPVPDETVVRAETAAASGRSPRPVPERPAPRAPSDSGPERTASRPVPERRAPPPRSPAVSWPAAPELASYAPTPIVVETSARERLGILRGLNADPESGAELGREGRAELIERLGGGWASRRALSLLIRSRGVETLSEALALIDLLDTATRQAWCLADLIAEWDLDEAERERVLDAAPTEAARRRLERRRRALR